MWITAVIVVTVLITGYYGYHYLMVSSDHIGCCVFRCFQCLLAYLLVTTTIMLLQLLLLAVVLLLWSLLVTAYTVLSLLVTQN